MRACVRACVRASMHVCVWVCLCVHVCISLWDVTFHANTERFRGSVPLLPHLCPLSVPEVGVCGVYSESP